MIVLLVVLGILILLGLALSLRIVTQYQQGVLFRLGRVQRVRDPGLAMITGKWADVGRFKVPGLRGLAARAPYFHDGSAATLEDVVTFYDRRFGLGLGPQDVSDLAAFLRAL